ncbi:CHC2 zinc finger domain-containing protein [Pseudoxanthomonas sp. LjRoot127]|uniref:CHC2 zinc finger domain-containing protein n=2 Tax=unclassified Pseudoxanthomonas TaxID=2645906 RepID=UPI003F503211
MIWFYLQGGLVGGWGSPVLKAWAGDDMNSTRDVLDSLEIDEVATALGMHLQRSKRGESKAICPFHADKEPSLVIYSDRSAGKQHFHCYACGEHGDAIDLVKGVLKIDFKAALEWLGSRYKLPASQPAKSSIKAPSSNGLALALDIYRRNANGIGLAEWLAARGIDSATAASAELVLAPNNTLSNFVGELAGDEAREVSSNLADHNLIRRLLPTLGSSYNLRLERGYRYSDYFPGERVVIPIRDLGGTLVGLAARAADATPAKESPKYMLNKGLQKASHLYNGHLAFARLRSKASDTDENLHLFVCEGFFDSLRLSTFGIPAVAVMGSSLSYEQAKIIRSLASEVGAERLVVNVLMDDDESGLRGASQSIKQLLELGLRTEFSFPYEIEGGNPSCKDPDCLLRGQDQDVAQSLLREAALPPATAVLAAEYGANARALIDNGSWSSAPLSRRILALERATGALRRLVAGADRALPDWISQPHPQRGRATDALGDWLAYVESTRKPAEASSGPFSSNEDAKLNHARLLAYKGSRRGELPCDEPRWERLDQAATMFNIALKERLASPFLGDMPPYDAVWVPRSFGKEEPRLKVMPPCEVLTIQQYILNEILSERLDALSAGSKPFSHCVPAVRYYRESDKVCTTGLGAGPDSDSLEVPLSYAYQIDMEVVEGRQPATDQGMFRPFSDCWKHFVRSINEQSEKIGFVYTERLDAVRYYDRIRRYVARDALLPKLSQALGTIPNGSSNFCQLLSYGRGCGGRDDASTVLDYLTSSLFGYTYQRPDNGEAESASDNMGIPQGPVTSAWFGSIALFPVDEVALELKQRYNVEGNTRIGYARYVDDIVLLADSAQLLEEFKRQVVLAAGRLDLILVAKAQAIPPMSSSQFAQFITSGRAMAVSGPAWEPTLVGDGDSGWEPWVALPDTDRQSALQILSDWTLYSSDVPTILRAVRTAFLAPDIRASELAKGARLIWYAVAMSLTETEREATATFGEALDLFDGYWEQCCSGATWILDPNRNPWELPLAFAVEGLDKVLDTSSYPLSMLNAQENYERRARLAVLAEIARKPDFPQVVSSRSRSLAHQVGRRLELILWKAKKGAKSTSNVVSQAELARTPGTWNSFEWMHLAVDQLQRPRLDGRDPLEPLREPINVAEKRAADRGEAGSFSVVRQLLPDLTSSQASDSEYSSIALQTIVSVVPRSELVRILSRRAHLLGDAEDGLLLLPPLPGIDQQRLIACTSADAVVHMALVDEIRAYEPVELGDQSDPLLLGAQEGHPGKWDLPWVKSSRGSLDVRVAAVSDMKFRALRTPRYSMRGTPKEVARLFRAIVRVANKRS